MKADRLLSVAAIGIAAVATIGQMNSCSDAKEANRVAAQANASAIRADTVARDTEEKFQMLSNLLLEQGNGMSAAVSSNATSGAHLDSPGPDVGNHDSGISEAPVLGPKPGRRRD